MVKVTAKKKKGIQSHKAFFEFVQEISEEKKLEKEKVLDILKSSFLAAYQNKYGLHADLEVILDPDKHDMTIVHRRTVMEKPIVPGAQISLEEAQKTSSAAKIGDVLEDRFDPLHTSRIIATNIRQVMMQRLRDLERELIYNEYKGKEGELINGYFLRWRDREVVYVDLGRAEGILPRREQIPGERFRSGDRVKALIKSVELKREKFREGGPFIILSRASADFVQKLFEMEIPEIYDGIIDIADIVRQAGYRTKLLVRSNRQDVDPVGACVGIKGVRIQAIVRELGNERIDIVNDSQEPQELIANALSPAEVVEVRVDTTAKEAFVVVTDNSYSIAIGSSGHNVRLASQLTKYNIVVKSQTQFNEEMSSPEAKAHLESLFKSQPEQTVEEEFTPLGDIPGLTQRILGLLEGEGIKNVEELIEVSEEDLSKFSGIGKNTAKQIRKILAETIEFEDV